MCKLVGAGGRLKAAFYPRELLYHIVYLHTLAQRGYSLRISAASADEADIRDDPVLDRDIYLL